MPFVPAPNICEVQFRTTFNGEQTMNRIHVDVLTTPTAAICASLAATCAQWWLTNVVALVPGELIIREVYVKSIESQPGPEATFSAGFPLAGSLGDPSLPNNVTVAASLRSNLTGRSARGRWYWQGLTEPQVTGNTIGAGVLVSIDGALTNLASTISGAGFLWVIVSFRTNNAPRVGGPVYFTVEDIVFVDDVVDSQRRRLPGRGR